MKSIKIGVVTSRFNEEVTSKLEQGALEFLEGCGDDLEVYAVRVPGAIEIPLSCQTLLERGCDGVVALGAVIRGETTHYEFVSNSVERGLTELMLRYQRPIGCGVLTTENENQAWARTGGKHGHKGREAAQVTLEMIRLLRDLNTHSFQGAFVEAVDSKDYLSRRSQTRISGKAKAKPKLKTKQKSN